MKKLHLKISSAKCLPFCSGFIWSNVNVFVAFFQDSGGEMDWAAKPVTAQLKDMKAPLDLLNGCIHQELQNIKLQ